MLHDILIAVGIILGAALAAGPNPLNDPEINKRDE